MDERRKARDIEALFKNPTSEYRSRPFWAWNGRLEPEALCRQVREMKQMGYGGFHIHSRIGLSTEYLGPAFMECVRACRETARGLGMETCLYDEDKWPSGYGAGRVTREAEYRAQHLLLTHERLADGPIERPPRKGLRITAGGDARFLAAYQVQLSEGNMTGYRRLSPGEDAGGDGWYVYRVTAANQPWFNNAAYVDALNPDAVRRFIEVAYEPYAKLFGSPFPKDVPSIFTDEPEMYSLQPLADGACPGEAGIAYTGDMPEWFRRRCGVELIDVLPELFWNWADGRPSTRRWIYFDLLTERFCAAYAGTIGQWCRTHGIDLAGHLMDESTLAGQSRTSGDAMRCYADYALPGIDILADRHEYTTAKQLQSVVRQMGKKGAMCECYGVTNWDFTFARKKHQGDWLAALGVTHQVPHLVWMQMGGEAKRDYPSPLDTHAPWHGENHLIEDYFARLSVLLRRGKSVVKIAVLHPVESQWLAFGPAKQSADAGRILEDGFQAVTKALLFDALDFDYLSEGLLKERPPRIEGKRLRVGEMQYGAVVVPPMLTLRSETLKWLRDFREAGGAVLFVGDAPGCVDASPDPGARELAKRCLRAETPEALPPLLEPWRDVRVVCDEGREEPDLIYQMRQEGERRWLFICHASEQPPERLDVDVAIRGQYDVTQYDALTGETEPVPRRIEGDQTIVPWRFWRHDALLLRLDPAGNDAAPVRAARRRARAEIRPVLTGFSLCEDNVFVIDRAAWRVDGGAWNPPEEILCADTSLRRQLGLRQRSDSFPQPWLAPVGVKEHVVELEMSITSRTALSGASLAWEGDSDVELDWNGEKVVARPDGHWLDSAFHLAPLPPLRAGENRLRMTVPFGTGTNLENCFLIGKFGAFVRGEDSWINGFPQGLEYGNAAEQGLAFYGGSIDYEMRFALERDADLEIAVPRFEAPLASVWVDERPAQPVWLAPYTAALGCVAAGDHALHVRCWGNRVNQFGQLHNDGPRTQYFGPVSWRRECGWWNTRYQLRPFGLMEAPVIRLMETETAGE